jgi:HAD superfamily hydrolase (TIGR01549 family)
MKKLFAFDGDGTLFFTSSEYRYRVFRETFEALGMWEFDNELIDDIWFRGDRDEILKKRFKLDDVSNIWEEFRKRDSVELRKHFTRPYDDTDFVKELKNKGYKTGIVTGAPLYIASMEIDLIGREFFDAVIVAQISNGIQPKPHPHGLQECLNLLQVQNEEALYVGNGIEDIQTARNAGVLSVLIDRKEHKLPEEKPDVVIYSLHELEQFL